jgi:DNA-binding transcriptional regulator YdaS (Cro superfamily)
MEAIEAATDGRVTRHHQRPDVYGPPPKKRRAA